MALVLQKASRTFYTTACWAIAFFLFLASVYIGYSTSPITNASSCPGIADPLPAWLSDGVNRNKSAYINASNSTGVPWEMLAAIHYRETNFSRSNPANGQGIFQFVNGEGGPYPAGSVSDSEFQRQLNFMASKIQNDYVYRGSLQYTHRPLTQNETEIFRIKDTLFSYNGRSSQYANQASQYGFSPSTQPYEGSPYVMNRFDCKRFSMGIITKDYGGIDGNDTRFGAFTLFARLKGDSYWQSLVTENLPGCPAATNTNLSCVWQLTNLATGGVIQTGSIAERDSYVTQGYQFQGTAYYGILPYAPNPGNIPIYSLKQGTGTFLTADQNEYLTLKNAGWGDNGIAFYQDPAGSNTGYPVYRYYSSEKGNHRFASNKTEMDALSQDGYTKEGIAFTSVSSVKRETAPPSGAQLVYRFGSMPGNTHFWTTDVSERDNMIKSGYRYEGVAWRSVSSNTANPIYRLYSESMQKHLFTADAYEKNTLGSTNSWRYEGIAWYGGAQNSKPVYRLYSPSTTNHFFTTDPYERSELIRTKVFRDEGTAWYQP